MVIIHEQPGVRHLWSPFVDGAPMPRKVVLDV
jgi:hypothetical protein